MTPETKLDLSPIKAAEAKATPGPWKRHEPSGAIDGEAGVLVALGTWPGTGEFIASSRTDVPALVAEVERLRADLARACLVGSKARDERGIAKRENDALAATVKKLRDDLDEAAGVNVVNLNTIRELRSLLAKGGA